MIHPVNILYGLTGHVSLFQSLMLRRKTRQIFQTQPFIII